MLCQRPLCEADLYHLSEQLEVIEYCLTLILLLVINAVIQLGTSMSMLLLQGTCLQVVTL